MKTKERRQRIKQYGSKYSKNKGKILKEILKDGGAVFYIMR